jgi:hypothetical protein
MVGYIALGATIKAARHIAINEDLDSFVERSRF